MISPNYDIMLLLILVYMLVKGIAYLATVFHDKKDWDQAILGIFLIVAFVLVIIL